MSTEVELWNHIHALEAELEALKTKETPDVSSGTWTAAFACGTSGTITISGTNCTGYYVKVGKAVFISGRFVVSSVSSPVGFLKITGLPFTSDPTVNNYISAISIYGTGLTAAAVTALEGLVPSNSNEVRVLTFAAGAAVSNVSDCMQTNAVITVGGVYMAA